jgi:hypothetical protein
LFIQTFHKRLEPELWIYFWLELSWLFQERGIGFHSKHSKLSRYGLV